MVRRTAQQAHAPSSRPFPLGAVAELAGVNFSVYSHHAEALELLLYDSADAAAPARVIALDRHGDRTGDYWHVRVPGLAAGQIYAWRAQGPFDPARGRRFDGDKVLLDPYGRAVAVPAGYRRAAAALPGDNARAGPQERGGRSPAATTGRAIAPLRRPFAQTVIYEMHVRGFTQPPQLAACRPTRRGTYAGLIEKIPYLRDLGITAVELLPVFQFDAQDAPRGPDRTTGATRRYRSSRRTPATARRAEPLGRARRVPRHGQGAAPRRHRGDPGRGLQPHRRGR